MDFKVYRYLACGGSNTILDIILYFLSYHFLFHKEPWIPFEGIVIAPHIAAFIFSFCIVFPIGFYLMSTVVFADSGKKKMTSLIRYFLVAMFNICLNYVLLKILVEKMGIFATPSKILSTIILIMVSFYLQRNFTFKKKA